MRSYSDIPKEHKGETSEVIYKEKRRRRSPEEIAERVHPKERPESYESRAAYYKAMAALTEGPTQREYNESAEHERKARTYELITKKAKRKGKRFLDTVADELMEIANELGRESFVIAGFLLMLLFGGINYLKIVGYVTASPTIQAIPGSLAILCFLLLIISLFFFIKNRARKPRNP